jgi:ppGpp synthetase/RelA/SpoT-type nucleotidyltranferase
MPLVESRIGANSAGEVLTEFDLRKDHLAEISRDTKQLIEKILKGEKIPVQSVQTRIKAREKLESKYCNANKDYKCLDDISDVVGFRIITYYSDKIDQIAEIIAREFEQRSSLEDKRKWDPNSFGYSAIHMDCVYSAARLSSTEYRHFADARFEIQITTVLGHAWAEMQHPWYDEFDPPPEELRRFQRLAAVLELAEQEFLEVRKKKDDRERIASVRVEAKAPEVPVTAESLKALIEDESVSALDGQLATILGGTISESEPNSGLMVKLASLFNELGIVTIQVLQDKLSVGKGAITEFATRCAPIWDAVRGDYPRTYTKGLAVLHLAYLLAGIPGPGRLRVAVAKAGISFAPGLDIGALADVAQDVAKRFRF